MYKLIVILALFLMQSCQQQVPQKPKAKNKISLLNNNSNFNDPLPELPCIGSESDNNGDGSGEVEMVSVDISNPNSPIIDKSSEKISLHCGDGQVVKFSNLVSGMKLSNSEGSTSTFNPACSSSGLLDFACEFHQGNILVEKNKNLKIVIEQGSNSPQNLEIDCI